MIYEDRIARCEDKIRDIKFDMLTPAQQIRKLRLRIKQLQQELKEIK